MRPPPVVRRAAPLRLLAAALLIALAGAPAPRAQSPAGIDTWPDEERAFYFGAAWLLGREGRAALLAMSPEERATAIAGALADPLPETPENELRTGVDQRLRLVGREFVSLLDDRAKLLLLHGRPTERTPVDCDQAFRPIEIWTYGSEPSAHRLILYQPRASDPFRLWLPLDSKRVLYGEEMEYWLEQFEELRGRISGRRFDLQICRLARTIDEVTGVDGLFGFRPGRPSNEAVARWLEPPRDRAAWARAAAADVGQPGPAPLAITTIKAAFPERSGQRILLRLTLTLPADAGFAPFKDEAAKTTEVRLNVDGEIESGGTRFDTFRMRFPVPLPDGETRPVAVVVERALRPSLDFVLHLRLRDEVSGAETMLHQALRVPAAPAPEPEPVLAADVVVVIGERLESARIAGLDSLVIVPPESDVVLGLWRTDVLVTGERISKVVFTVDDQQQFVRSRPPWSAELRLSKYPTEQVVRVEGYDSAGALVAADEVVLNQQRGQLRVRIVEPRRGTVPPGPAVAAVEVVVPEERRVIKVEIQINDRLVATLERPPWRAEITVPQAASAQDVVYLTAVAELDDGSRAEDVRFLNVPDFAEAVEVDLVELYTTVNDKSGGLVLGLGQDAFTVLEDERPQEISKFELVENLPLNLGITIDTSGSMIERLGEARRAAQGFLSRILKPQDRCFAVAFSSRPELISPRTADAGAVSQSLDRLQAQGATALHDAVITSLYYFRGIRGRRALVLLSDGEDTSSTIVFRDALEYARRSGVAIYAVGLGIGRLDLTVREKLGQLANETGGRVFYIGKAEELEGAYSQIERELRSQYLLAYASDHPAGQDDGAYRKVEVQVKGSLSARTIRGYYP